MHFTRITLSNWKAFKNADFVFPAPTQDRTVVLIGGKNGYGKTSLLEAVTFGLYGHRAITDIDTTLRAIDEMASSSPARRQAYRRYIQRALHEPAREAGETSASVTLEFETADGPLVVERRWHFYDGEPFSEEDEELVLRVGDDQNILAIPEGQEPLVFYQDEIGKRLLPPSLAPFFLFDGEQVKRMAEREMTEQIRLGMESLLGFHIVRETASDLRDYARDRMRGGSSEIGRQSTLFDEIEILEADKLRIQSEHDELQNSLIPHQEKRDDLVSQIGSATRGTFASQQELLEQHRAAQQTLSEKLQTFITVVSAELPLVLVGNALRKATEERLRQEAASNNVVLAQAERETTLARLLLAFDQNGPELPKLEREQLHSRIRQAWDHLTKVSTSSTRHWYLTNQGRLAAAAYLAAAPALQSNLDQHGMAVKAASENLDRRTTDISKHDQLTANAELLRTELKELNARIEELERQRRALDQELGRLEGKLSPLKMAYEALNENLIQGGPTSARAARAIQLSNIIDTIIARSSPIYLERLADAVTRAYQALAHKGIVWKVQLQSDGSVALLDKHGRNIKAFDVSAGESQVFAMATIAGVADVVGGSLPVMIDTPLGRLDPEHRERMLDFFTSRSNQTILLSQPGEVNGPYLQRIANRVAATFLLDHHLDEEGIGGSTVQTGYFMVSEG